LAAEFQGRGQTGRPCADNDRSLIGSRHLISLVVVLSVVISCLSISLTVPALHLDQQAWERNLGYAFKFNAKSNAAGSAGSDAEVHIYQGNPYLLSVAHRQFAPV
jgi:hypothetical protein